MTVAELQLATFSLAAEPTFNLHSNTLWWFIKSVVRADCRLSEKELYLLLIIKSLEQCMEQCIFMEMLSLSTSDHNASAVDPGCFMVYNCFQFHGFITNNKCR